MFIALYEMKVKTGKEKQFERAWAKTTEAIYKKRGTRGSILHKTDKQNIYIAYAQWPSKDIYFNDEGKDTFTKEELETRDSLRVSTEYIKTLHLMDVLDDRSR